jgi:hypothetical protein
MKTLVVLLLLVTTGCASLRHHPVLYGMAAGVATGATIAILTRHTCPHAINGYPYDGTPPCPNPATYDPGRSQK